VNASVCKITRVAFFDLGLKEKPSKSKTMKKSIYRQQLDELNGEQNEPKKDKKKKKWKSNDESAGGRKNILQRFNEKKAKGDVQTTILKTVADVAGIGIGTVLSAAAGKATPLLSLALIGGGHYIGDESGLMRTVGASAFAHSIAKAKEYREHPDQTIKDRLSSLKDEWLIALLMKHYDGQNINGLGELEPISQSPASESLPNIPDFGASSSNGDSYGEINLATLDQFDQLNEQAAEEFEQHQTEAHHVDDYLSDTYSEPNYRYDPDDYPRSWPPKSKLNQDYDWTDDPEFDFSNF
jgi:hypothetical protein